MNKLMGFSLFILPCLLLSACSTTKTVETYHPGYYQPGRYYEGGYQTAYYDVYGNYHPAHDVGAYYQQGRWHRPFVDVTHYEYAGTTAVGCSSGGGCSGGCGSCSSDDMLSIVLDDGTLGFISADGDLDTAWEPTER